jgi:hypothetical protein
VRGGLGTLVGARTTLAIATTLLCLAALPVLTSRLRTTRDISDLAPPPPEPAMAHEAR